MAQELEKFISAERTNRKKYQHIHRYALCREYVEGKRVLDVGIGAGYGAFLLAEKAMMAVGLDMDRAAIAQAKKHYRAENLNFVFGDFRDMPFEKASFDVVVSEFSSDSIKYPYKFIQEVKRVLKSGGILILSIPRNIPLATHMHSDMSDEDVGGSSALADMLDTQFAYVRMTGMRMGMLSLGFRMNHLDPQPNLPTALTYIGDFKGMATPGVQADELWLDRPDYVLAVCSNKPLPSEMAGSSLFVSRDNDLMLEHDQFMSLASTMGEEERGLRSELDDIKEQLLSSRSALEKSVDAYQQLDQRHSELSHYAASSVTISRLLSRMSGEVVTDDSYSIIESLFTLNQKMTIERSQMEAAKAQAARLEILEQDAISLRAQLAQASRDLEKSQESLTQERSEARAIAHQMSMREEALTVAEKDCAALRDRLDHINGLLEDEQAEARGLKAKLRNKEQEGSQIVALHAQEQAEFQKLKRQYENVLSQKSAGKLLDGTNAQVPPEKAQGVPVAGAATRESNRQAVASQRELERFVKVHSNIQRQIFDASQGLQERIAPPQQRKRHESFVKKWRRKFDRDAASFRTILFDSHWLTVQSPEMVGIRFGRYLRDARLWKFDPHPLFSSSFYLSNNPDVAAEAICPLLHYLEHGWREGRNPHPYFFNDWYLNQNPDVLAVLTITPLEHYLEHGWREGRAPNPLFNPKAYIDRYPDVAEADMEPLTHYVVHGRQEHREIPLPAVNPSWSSLLSRDDQDRGLLDFILEKPPLALPEQSIESVRPVASINWPPERLNDFWLPQKLRDFIIEGGNESEIDLYTYLCSVMEAFHDGPELFPQSPACQQISDRIRAISATRYRMMPDQPDASIIIPVYNNVIDTLLCICSVLEDSASKSYEIIVADDGSSDATPQIIATLGGVVRYLRQPRNYGFVGNCNEAAKQARGRHVILLNNDTLVMPNWLDALLDTFELHDKVGLSGSKLISWDGTLQEAGGIYWKDGSAWNFGRGGDARAPEFNYLKDADYISGAAIAIPTDLWRMMNGFDEIYAPAYCEDSDIAFRLREAGYRTLMNPASEVLHHEGRSHGRDLNSGIKAYQVTNQKTFLERWRAVLERDHYPNAQNVLRARDRSYYRKHVLVIDHYVPQWDQDAGSRSTFMCIKALLNLGYAVTFWPDNLWRDPQYTPRLQEMGVEVIYGAEYRDGFGNFMRLRGELYDAVFANRPHIACNYMSAIRETSTAKIIYYGHDLHFKRMMAAQVIGEPVEDADIAMMRNQELDVCAQADIVLYPDQLEVDLVERELGGERLYRALPVYAFEKDKFAQSASMLSAIPGKTQFRLLFVGGFNHTPNLDGILWFVRDIFPIIQGKLANVHLTIVGSKAPQSVISMAGEAIDVAGFVSDDRLSQLYEETSLVIAPLRYGGGVKGKVIEAMATGVPLVTTPIGAQGLQDPSRLMFMATEAEAFAEAIIYALTDRTEAEDRARRAWDYARTHYSMEALENLFHEFID